MDERDPEPLYRCARCLRLFPVGGFCMCDVLCHACRAAVERARWHDETARAWEARRGG
jgi:hypothetical protein